LEKPGCSSSEEGKKNQYRQSQGMERKGDEGGGSTGLGRGEEVRQGPGEQGAVRLPVPRASCQQCHPARLQRAERDIMKLHSCHLFI
jgi:hypothetical protein